MATAVSIGRGNWCSACGTTLAGHEVVRLTMGDPNASAQYYCAACAGHWLRCAACRRTLDTAQGHLFALAGQAGRLYCPECWARPHCHACGRPVGPVSFQRADGRVLCEACHATAVYDPTLAYDLFGRVRETAKRVLDMELNVGASLRLVNRGELNALRGHAAGPDPIEDAPAQEGDADYVGLFVHGWRTRAIYVEYGLPRIFFCEVVAHEYAHAWQAENAPLLATPELREGFAEWVAYKVVESWGCRLRLDRFRGRQDIYGAGLRRLLAWEAAEGVAGVRDHIQRER